MTVAELEKPVEPFVMPKVRAGQSVLFYIHGEPVPSVLPEIAFVLKSSQKSIVLRTASGYVRDSVMHLSDPRLKDKEELKKDGAWDYCAEEKELKAKLADLTKRLEAVEALLNEPAKKK